MIDLTKLVPWRLMESLTEYLILDASSYCLGKFYRREDAEKACLMAAAAEVQERRGWTAMRVPVGWAAVEAPHNWAAESDNTVMWAGGKVHVADDPFTCLVDADRWLKEQGK